MTWNGLTPNSFWFDSHRLLFQKDCRLMADLPDESVQMVVTSPPYWGLRKYTGLPDLIWGGKEDCQHEWGEIITERVDETGFARNRRGLNKAAEIADGNPRTATTDNPAIRKESQFCSLCGAWKGAYGLEPAPGMYVQHTIDILREVRRVLREDGVVFWNIGDSYAGSNSGKGDYRAKKGLQKDIYDWEHPQSNTSRWDKWRRGNGGEENGVSLSGIPRPLNLKPKDLCLIPFRVAIAAQEDGWYCRSVIIWNKPNPMPESVRDRPTESHEYILMLTKSARYYYDQEAVREPITYPDRAFSVNHLESRKDKDDQDAYSIGSQAQDAYYAKLRKKLEDGESTGRNLRSVWTFPTQPYPEAHFATYPEKLVEICVKAATPEVGCCAKCGKPWVRITETKLIKNRPSAGNDPRSRNEDRRAEARGHGGWKGNNLLADVQTLGWKPQCKCEADKIPSIVLDPFAGSGTTLKVAAELNRRAIGYELSQKYCSLAVERNKQAVLV